MYARQRVCLILNAFFKQNAPKNAPQLIFYIISSV